MSQHEKRIPVTQASSPKPGQVPGKSPVRGRSLDEFRNDLVALFARARGQASRPGS